MDWVGVVVRGHGWVGKWEVQHQPPSRPPHACVLCDATDHWLDRAEPYTLPPLQTQSTTYVVSTAGESVEKSGPAVAVRDAMRRGAGTKACALPRTAAAATTHRKLRSI